MNYDVYAYMCFYDILLLSCFLVVMGCKGDCILVTYAVDEVCQFHNFYNDYIVTLVTCL